MAKRVLIGLFAVVVFGALAAFIVMGLKGKSLPKIKYSHFESPEKAGQAIRHILRQDLKYNSVIMLGVLPDNENHKKVWRAFIEVQDIAEFSYQVLDLSSEIDLNVVEQTMLSALASNTRLAIIYPSYHVSHAVSDNFINQFEKRNQKKVMSISLVPFPISREDEADYIFPCNTNPELDKNGLGMFGCLIMNKARTIYRKKYEASKITGLMDQFGDRDYLMLINF